MARQMTHRIMMKKKMKTVMKTLAIGLLMGMASPGVMAAQEGLEEAPLVEGLKDLKKLDRQLVSMATRCGEATVSLVSRGGAGAGSGVIVSEEGLILTAAHVVASLSDEVIVIFPDGSRKSAKKLGADFDRDAAMVQITEDGTYPYVELGKSDGLLRNEWCVALGHPGGFDPMRTPPVRLGRVLRLGEFTVTDCAVVGGDSGGPLFDVEGNVIGIHSNIGLTLSENRHVPIAVFHEQWKSLKSGEQKGKRFAGKQGPPKFDPERPVLGVQLGEPTESGGVAVEGVMEDSPAEQAGLKAGDTIVAVNGKKANSREELIDLVSEFSPGTKVKIAYLRDGKRRKMRVQLARLGDMMDKVPQRDETPGAEKGPEKKDQPKGKDKDAQAKNEGNPLKDLLEEALKNGGRLEMTPETLEKLGGMKDLSKRLQEMTEQMDPELLGRLMQGRNAAEPDDFFASSMKALESVVAKASEATVLVFVDGKPVALGTVVSEEGWILTKDTETQKGTVEVLIGEDKVAAKLLKRFPKRDLALFQVKSKGLRSVRWATAKRALPLGSLLTASGPGDDPLGIGVISVQTRAMAEVGFLGIQTEDAEDGVMVLLAVPDAPAAKAGLEKGDVILSIDGEKAGAAHEFGDKVRAHKAGDEVKLKVRNGEKTREVKVKLMARQNAPSSKRGNRMNQMSGPLSARQTGFPEALQHDIPIAPSMCGGPLLNLDGRAVGINVSRAGRIKTLAVPASDVLSMLASVENVAATETPEASAADATSAFSDQERAEVLKVIEEVRQTLEGLEERLEKMGAR